MNISKITTLIKTSLLALYVNIALMLPASAGGLDEATDAAEEIKTWAYTFLGSCVFIYMIYKVIMAMMEKETWGDVLTGLAKSAMAGGVIVGTTWAWGIFA